MHGEMRALTVYPKLSRGDAVFPQIPSLWSRMRFPDTILGMKNGSFVCSILVVAFCAVAAPAGAQHQQVLLGEFDPAGPIHEYRFRANAKDAFMATVESLTNDVELEFGQGEGKKFMSLTLNKPSNSFFKTVELQGSYILRLQSPPAKRRYRLIFNCTSSCMLEPVAHQPLTPGPQAKPQPVLRGNMTQTLELKSDDSPDPDFTVPHHLLRIEGQHRQKVQVTLSSSAFKLGALLFREKPIFERASASPLKLESWMPVSGYIEVRLLALDGRSGPYEVTVVTQDAPPLQTPSKVVYSASAPRIQSAPTLTGANGLPIPNANDPRASSSGRFTGLISIKACPDRSKWPSQGSEPLSFEQRTSGIYHCGERVPDRSYSVFWAGHYYYWRELVGPQRPLGDPTIGVHSSTPSPPSIRCKEQHQSCLRDCSPFPWNRTPLCIGLCDRALTNCRH